MRRWSPRRNHVLDTCECVPLHQALGKANMRQEDMQEEEEEQARMEEEDLRRRRDAEADIWAEWNGKTHQSSRNHKIVVEIWSPHGRCDAHATGKFCRGHRTQHHKTKQKGHLTPLYHTTTTIIPFSPFHFTFSRHG
jgi:hypothetical protein